MNRKHMAVLIALVLIGAFSIAAWGQSRRGRSISSPSTPGWGPSARRDYNLNRYYTGMNNLNVGYTPARGSGVLGSSIYKKQSMTISRGSQSVPAYFGPQRAYLSSGIRHRRVYSSASLRIPTLAAPARLQPGSIGAYLASSYASAGAYRSATRSRAREIPDEILTSLVPKEAAKHRQQMIKGEEAFRKGSYSQALAHFETARQLSNNSPESLLSLGRASFALADGSYTKTAQYLCKTLEIVPELPLIRVFPRSFYDNQKDYLQHLKNLEDHVEANPEDSEAQLIIGYIRWRQGKPDEARASLGAALTRAGAPWLSKGIMALLGGIASAEQARTIELPEMSEPTDYPCAGISLALPKGFTPGPLERRRQVMKATKTVDGDAMIIVLAGQPVGRNITPRGLWDWAMGFWQGSPAISDLRLVEERDVSVAGLPAVGRLFTYTSRGVDTAVLGLFFIREVSPADQTEAAEPIRIGYGLVVMTVRKQMDSMIGVINGVARSVELTNIRRPIDVPVELTDTSVSDLERRYSLQVPKGWTAGHDETGVVMGRMDHLLGGVSSPAVRVVALDVPKSMSAKACGESAIEHASEQQGFKVRVLSQGPAKLGGVEGYQFVVEKRTPLEASSTDEGKAGESKFSEPFVEVGRMVSLPTSDGRKNFYVVILTCYDCDAEQAEAIMNKLAGGFTLLD